MNNVRKKPITEPKTKNPINKNIASIIIINNKLNIKRVNIELI